MFSLQCYVRGVVGSCLYRPEAVDSVVVIVIVPHFLQHLVKLDQHQHGLALFMSVCTANST